MSSMVSGRVSDIPSLGETAPTLEWGSDAIVEQLSRLDLPYIALVPGSSYCGIHDSLVNYKANSKPELLLCLHEEHAVAIAHGYAKVTERPMAAAVHANVGLMHATMAIYNAFCDRVPMVILGATGPIDATRRRPWIDHIHTAQDQGALIRPFVKFDDQPHSVNAAIMSLVRARIMTATKPSAPTYVCFDVDLQEQKINVDAIKFPTATRFLQASAPKAAAADIQKIINALVQAKRPLMLMGRLSRSQADWDRRIELAEFYNSLVFTDLKQACAFPTDHRLQHTPPSIFISPEASELIRVADLIISFEWVDLAGTLSTACGPGTEPDGQIVHISLDSSLHNGWSKDHFDLPPVDIAISADADNFLSALLDASENPPVPKWTELPPKSRPQTGKTDIGDDIYMDDLAEILDSVTDSSEACLVRLPLSWRGEDLRATHPLAYLGQDGGAGIGSGPGQVVGAALALRDLPYIPIGILGDGDYLMGSSALWTAARHHLPLLVIVANNASFFNDEAHQERIAKARDRPVENKWIGVRLDDPLPDLSQNAASLGLTVLSGQVRKRTSLARVLREAVREVKAGRPVFVDVRINPYGYSTALGKSK